MKILVAYKENKPKNEDFFWTNENEILIDNMICDNGRRGNCGCERSFTGIDSRKATTTGIVTESEMSMTELLKEIERSEIAAFGEFDKGRKEEIKSFLLEIAKYENADVLETLNGKITKRK